MSGLSKFNSKNDMKKKHNHDILLQTSNSITTNGYGFWFSEWWQFLVLFDQKSHYAIRDLIY